MIADVKIYTTDYCPYCVLAKRLLTKKNVPYVEIDVTHDPEARTWLRKTTGLRTVPQIFIDGQSVGGSDELHALDRAGQLERMLHRSP